MGFIQIQKSFSKAERVSIVTAGQLETSFEEYVRYIMGGASNSDRQNRELLLVLYGFTVENMNGRATFYLKLEAFSGSKDHYKMIASVDTIYEHKQSLASANMKLPVDDNLFEMISHIASIDPDTIKEPGTYTFNEAVTRISDNKKKYPIYIRPANDGLYKTFEQFLDNKPESMPIKKVEKVIITESLTPYYVYVEKGNSKKGDRIDAKDFFAVHYNDAWYISDGTKFNVMTFEDGDFYTKAKMKAGHSVVYRYTALAGLVNVWTTPVKEEKTWNTYKARLDPEAGKLMPVKRIK